MDSFTERSPFVVPVDGKNLNRAFPGDPGGTYTDRLAHDIHTKLIAPRGDADRLAARVTVEHDCQRAIASATTYRAWFSPTRSDPFAAVKRL
jgi:hypothetical protein